MLNLFYIIVATLVVSALSFIGVITLGLKEARLHRLISWLVAFAAGALMGGALLHLLPEAIQENNQAFAWVLAGFAIFFLLEQFIHWHHCHDTECDYREATNYLIIIADGAHNFLDGVAIGAAFLINFHLGFITTLAVAAHEIPQELGDFAVLVHGGWNKVKALWFNFFSGLTAVAGGLLTWALASQIKLSWLIPLAAGNFIYIAASDLIPEVKHSNRLRQSINHFLAFCVGIGFMYALLWLE